MKFVPILIQSYTRVLLLYNDVVKLKLIKVNRKEILNKCITSA